MNLANLRRSQRIEVAAAQMIVVRADDDVFVGLPGQPCENVVDRRARRFDVDVQAKCEACPGKRRTPV